MNWHDFLAPLIILVLLIVAARLFNLIQNRSTHDPGPLIDGAGRLVRAAETLLAKIDRDPTTDNIVERVTRWAAFAVGAVEQLYKSGQLPKEERKAKAVQIVKDMLGVEFDLDDEDYTLLEHIIDAAIESAVSYLGKSQHPPAPGD